MCRIMVNMLYIMLCICILHIMTFYECTTQCFKINIYEIGIYNVFLLLYILNITLLLPIII